MPSCALRSALSPAPWFRALNRVVEPVVRSGAVSPLVVGPGAVILETTGRRSGLPRPVPLLASRTGRRVVVSTVRTDSQWVRNLEATPEASVWVAGKNRRATGSVKRFPGLSVAVLEMEPLPTP